MRALRSAWVRESKRDAHTSGEVAAAMERARREAQAAAFDGVDWAELEEAWRGHVLGLRRPETR